jgi:hypothetical protein
MKQLKGIILTAALLLTCAAPAWAMQYTFTFTSFDISGNGILEAVDNGDGTSTVISGSSSVDGVGTFTLVKNPTAPAYHTSPYNAFNYDDILYSSAPYLDVYGLLFFNADLTMELNIWGNGQNIPYSAWTFVQGSSGYSTANDNVTFSLNPVPEPSTLFLLGVGCAGLAGLARFKRRNRTMV